MTATVKISERADEVRLAINGKLCADSVDEALRAWQAALKAQRRFIVDISELTGYDRSGRKLLREMHQHGATFAAATPGSLVFLSEISAPRHRPVTIIPAEATEAAGPSNPPKEDQPKPFVVRSATRK